MYAACKTFTSVLNRREHLGHAELQNHKESDMSFRPEFPTSTALLSNDGEWIDFILSCGRWAVAR